MLKWIIFVLAVLVTATALRYVLRSLGRFGLTFGSRVVHLNVVAFWLVLAVGGIVILVKLIALIAGRAQK